MGQFMVDVSDIPEAVRGSEVTLLGTDHGAAITAEALGDSPVVFPMNWSVASQNCVPRIYL